MNELQWLFLLNLCELIEEIKQRGFTASGGELHRTPEQQEIYFKTGKSKTLNSLHLKKLAIDLFIFKDGKLVESVEELKYIGDYWEGLHARNRWGGYFPKWHQGSTFVDAFHFECNI